MTVEERRRKAGCARLAILLVVGLAAACTPVRFGSLQAEYETVVEARQRCEAAPSPDLQACAGDTNLVFLEIAQNARKAAAQADNAKTRIGLYRLMALAGWQSRVEEGFALQAEASARGRALCDGLKDDRYRPPRDCALFGILPYFVAHARAVAVLEPLRAKPRAAWTDEDKAALATLAAPPRDAAGQARPGYYVEIWSGSGALKAQRDGLAAVPATRRTAAMIDWQRDRIYCALNGMLEAATTADLRDIQAALDRQIEEFQTSEKLETPDCTG